MAVDLAANAASKLEPYLLMSKSAKGAAAAKLVQDATTAQGVFVFGELLDVPSIQQLDRTDQAPYLKLLQLFAYGTLEDYIKQREFLPPLNQSQITKLKLLTLVSLSLRQRILPYSLLLQSLQIETIRELEDLIIDGIYLELLRGKLDQKAQQFEVEYAAGRDLAPGELETLLNALQDWSRTTSSLLTTLDTELNNLSSQRNARREALADHEKQVAVTVDEVFAQKMKSVKAKRDGLEDMMDVDGDPRAIGEPGSSKGKKWKPSLEHVKLGSRKRNRF